MPITKSVFDTFKNGTPVMQYTLTSDTGLAVTILDYGATVQAIRFAGKDVALGFSTIYDYACINKNYLGATVGRYANRIANGQFTLSGKTYTLAQNNGRNSLHGGMIGFDKKMWKMEMLSDGDTPSIRATLFSPDGDEGFPGNIQVAVTFTVDADRFCIHYDANTDADTVLNFTNHTYFNLNGYDGENILDTEVTVYADSYTPTDGNLIPLGVYPVDGTAFDFRRKKTLGEAILSEDPQIRQCGGIDHNFVIRGECGVLRPAMTAKSPKTGIAVTCLTDLPGLQIYTSNGLSIPVGKGGPIGEHQGFCMETQYFPDTPNQPTFPSCVVRAGTHFHSETAYAFVKE